jgi:hypothetical protein
MRSARSEPCSTRERRLSIADFPLQADQLEEWDGICLELVNDLLWSHPTGAILYVDNLPFDHRWRYHAALVLDGIVYDAWNPYLRLRVSDYVCQVFGDEAEWTIFDSEDD